MRAPLNICGEKLAPKVDCNNDILMVSEGLRAPLLNADPLRFAKTKEEKDALKEIKFKRKFDASYSSSYRANRVKHRLVVYMKKSPVADFKSTHSVEVFQSEIGFTISALREKGYRISKAYFNNKPLNI